MFPFTRDKYIFIGKLIDAMHTCAFRHYARYLYNRFKLYLARATSNGVYDTAIYIKPS